VNAKPWDWRAPSSTAQARAGGWRQAWDCHKPQDHRGKLFNLICADRSPTAFFYMWMSVVPAPFLLLLSFCGPYVCMYIKLQEHPLKLEIIWLAPLTKNLLYMCMCVCMCICCGGRLKHTLFWEEKTLFVGNEWRQPHLLTWWTRPLRGNSDTDTWHWSFRWCSTKKTFPMQATYKESTIKSYFNWQMAGLCSHCPETENGIHIIFLFCPIYCYKDLSSENKAFGYVATYTDDPQIMTVQFRIS
jgi:hypothetical protein